MSAATTYTSYTRARERFASVLEQVEQGDSIVIVQRQGHKDVAMIAADELSALLEEVYLFRSPANARRLLEALEWSDKRLSEPPKTTSLEEFRQEMENEIEREEASEA